MAYRCLHMPYANASTSADTLDARGPRLQTDTRTMRQLEATDVSQWTSTSDKVIRCQS